MHGIMNVGLIMSQQLVVVSIRDSFFYALGFLAYCWVPLFDVSIQFYASSWNTSANLLLHLQNHKTILNFGMLSSLFLKMFRDF